MCLFCLCWCYGLCISLQNPSRWIMVLLCWCELRFEKFLLLWSWTLVSYCISKENSSDIFVFKVCVAVEDRLFVIFRRQLVCLKHMHLLISMKFLSFSHFLLFVVQSMGIAHVLFKITLSCLINAFDYVGNTLHIECNVHKLVL